MAKMSLGDLYLLAAVATAELDDEAELKLPSTGQGKVTVSRDDGVDSTVKLRRSGRKGKGIMMGAGDFDLNLPPYEILSQEIQFILENSNTGQISPREFYELVILHLEQRFGIEPHVYRKYLKGMIMHKFKHFHHSC